MRGLNPGRICSHPGKPLDKHLIQVLRIAQSIAERFETELSPVIQKGIVLHDLGKAHPQFRVKLCGVCNLRGNTCLEYEEGVRGHPFGHAEPSAALVLAVTNDILCAEIVRRHHTELQNLADVHRFWTNDFLYQDNCGSGIRDIISRLYWWPGAEEIAKVLASQTDGHDFSSGDTATPPRWASLLPAKNEWEDTVFELLDDIAFGEFDKSPLWLKTRLAYSIFVTSDRWEASTSSPLDFDKLTVDPRKVSEYLEGRGGRFATWRQLVRQKVGESARRTISKPGLYTLTLPTGTGKTTIGLEIAMEVAQQFGAKSIIYVLPFISVVEQNAGVAREILGTVQEDHHMAYMGGSGPSEDHDSTPAERFMSFFRYWHAPVVVTTLAKLWEVLFSPRANDSMSFHKLSQAVVILDEPQSVPARYWDGLGKTFELISHELNTTFILMTATQPEIGNGEEITKEDFNFPRSRYRIEWLGRESNRWTMLGLIDFLKSAGIRENDSLVVLNTRESALRVYFQLRRLGISPLFMLSRWLTPVDRRTTIQELRQRERDGLSRWLVSTQVVEAGMDLDFAMVLRDLGPLDTIIQVAGRCNRHGEREQQGQVFVIDLIDDRTERNRTYSSLVYDSVLLNQTRLVLDEHPSFEEAQCRELVSKYYHLVKNAVEQSRLWRNLVEGDWGEYERLIDKEPRNQVMLVIDRNGSIAPIAKDALIRGTGFEDIEKRRRLFRIISENSIEVRADYLEQWIPATGSSIFDKKRPVIEQLGPGLWLLNPEGIGQVYVDGIGFIPMQFYEQFPDILRPNSHYE